MNKRKGANSRKKVRRRSLRLPLSLALLLVAGTALGFGIARYGKKLPSLSFAFSSSAPVARNVVIEGAVQASETELLYKCGINAPVTMEQLKNVYLGSLACASPWVEKIKIVAVRNNAIVLSVVERKPVALLQTAGPLCLVDRQGVCLPLGKKTEYALPFFSGLADSIGAGGIRRLTGESAARMGAFLRSTAAVRDESFTNRITQAAFGRAPLVRVMLQGSESTVVMNEDDMQGCVDKYARFRATGDDGAVRSGCINLAFRNLAFVTTE